MKTITFLIHRGFSAGGLFAILFAAGLTSIRAQDTWIQKASFEGSARYGAVGFSIGTKGYIGTGFDFDNFTNDFWEYDPATDAWTQKADFSGAARYAAAGFSIGSKGYIGTGYTYGNVYRDFWEYDPATNGWTQKADFGGAARSGAAGLSIGTKGYIVTGYDFNDFTNDCWEYDPDTDTWTQKADFGGTGRISSVGFSIGSKGYIGTGYDGIDKNDFWAYDPSADTWEQRADFGGTARDGAVGFAIGSKGYIGIGGDQYFTTNDFWEYDPFSDAWTQKANFGGTARYAAVGFSLGSKGYIGTGFDANSYNYTNDFWEYTTEVCNGLTVYADADGDSYGDIFNSYFAVDCVVPVGYVTNSSDCNDNNDLVNPSAIEVCDGIDNNCDGNTDEGFLLTFYADADGDTYGDAGNSTLACSLPGGYVTDTTDCDDSNASVNPVALEICDGIDNNCNGNIDEGLLLTFYPDTDGDTYGDAGNSTLACSLPGGYVTNATDCDDSNAAVNPAAAEICDGIDNNCNGNTDEGLLLTFYADADDDTYGDIGNSTLACSPPAGYVADNTDCDDSNAAVNPVALEICDGIDNNCDGITDPVYTFYADADDDGYGDNNIWIVDCIAPAGYVADNTDCDDNNALVHPGALEICNNIDDNCDGETDEGVLSTFYADNDNDGFGISTSSVLACSAPVGYVSDNTDCDDSNTFIHPGAAEICNTIDDNCNGQTDEGVQSTFYADNDNDGFGNTAIIQLACSAPAGYVTDNTDCDDNNALVYPGATEVCNGIDDNCINGVDEGLVFIMYFQDADADGFGNPLVSDLTCDGAPIGFVTGNTDCDDSNPNVYPGAQEITTNGIDDNCNGVVDEFGVGIHDPNIAANFTIYPNPAEDLVTIHFSLPQSSHIYIKLYDVSGKEIMTLLNDDMNQGNHSLLLSTVHFSKGVYIVKMISDFGIVHGTPFGENQKLIVQ